MKKYKRTEYTIDDFSWTQWTAQDIEQSVRRMIAEKRSIFETVKLIPEADRTFENTLFALEDSTNILTDMYRVYLLMNVSPQKEVREAAARAMEYIERELVDIEYDEAIYRAIESYAGRHETLGVAETKLLKDLRRKYQRMGFDLAPDKQSILKENLKKLSELSNAFSRNINEFEDCIEVTLEELRGLPEEYIKQLKQATSGKYVVSLRYPELHPFLENAENETKRAELAGKYLRQGGEKNVELLKEIVRLRDENAELLGFRHHGDFRIEEKIARTSDQVFSFIHDILDSVIDRVREDVSVMREWKQKFTGDPQAELRHSDVQFVLNRMKRERFGVDKEMLRPYFPLERVKVEMFSIFGELFGVQFERMERVSAWHESVEVYRTLDRKSGETLAYFFLDLYPREGKYGHAAVFELVRGHVDGFDEDSYVCPSVALVTNFPGTGEDHSSYLDHAEVVTLFHEFGHLLHETLYDGAYASQSGFGVAHDFVETPSQMLEYWAWQPEVLQRISMHREMKKSLDMDTIKKMLEAKRFMAAYSIARQMVLSLFDMKLHTRNILDDINEEYAELVKKYFGIRLPEQQLFAAGFGHLMGYDAGYYGYMWAKVYAVDFFSQFEAVGVYNEQKGLEYRSKILATGSSREEIDIACDFLGRKPNNEAFLKEINV